MWILGLSAFYHDSAAALIRDGEVMAAAQEERFTRKKHDSRFPIHAVRYCLESAGLKLGRSRFRRLLRKAVPQIRAPAGKLSGLRSPRALRSFRMALPLWIREKLFQKDLLCRELETVWPDCDWDRRLLFTEHHQSHAASAFSFAVRGGPGICSPWMV